MVANSMSSVYTIMYNIWLKLHIIWVVWFHGVSYDPIQSQYIEVAKGAIFMEQNMRFGLILGLLAILKKNLGWLWATFEAVFFMFSWAKKKIVLSALKSCIISL